MSEGPRIAARGGLPAADPFLPQGAPEAGALVAPGVGLPRALHAAFASRLAESGIAALAVDHRGIGGSRDGTAPARRGGGRRPTRPP